MDTFCLHKIEPFFLALELLRRLFSSIVLGDDGGADRSWRLTPVGPCDASPASKPGAKARLAAYGHQCPFPAGYYDC